MIAGRWEIREGDALARLREMPDASVHMIVTSPPYWQLRDYGVEGQLGLEETPEEFVENLVAVFTEARRVLRPDGTCWVNLGDGYAGGGKGGGGTFMKERGAGSWQRKGSVRGYRMPPEGLKEKDLVGAPWMVALAMRADGWTLRSEIIWEKTNPFPESVTDRPTKAHEHMFLFAKSRFYFYDADSIREPHKDRAGGPERFGKTGQANAAIKVDPTGHARSRMVSKVAPADGYHPLGRNARTVWGIATEHGHDGHFATFPEELARRAIMAGTSGRGVCPSCAAPWVNRVEYLRTVDGVPTEERPALRNTSKSEPSSANGIGHSRIGTAAKPIGWEPSCACGPLNPIPALVLDPFAGAGTSGVAALGLQRRFLGLELKPEYCELARRRLAGDSPLFDLGAR